ncbi:LysR family transcriptional regulator [Litoreibacter albidus]|uniref:Transcriptional regulator, LysR family n=1 Tax=Litoreibacter albidus TaxID=670155 RepID=A0A1H2SDV5_9RHOB|nr:LysR family transcriptional regulator [Litoreibacter albidus]SDW29762.1 transcriptional regulator, LysR family [Litoreibacter albidus]
MHAPLDSDLIRSFLAVVDAGSVTGAADQIGRTQSAVSMQIRKLEENLGQSIFVREPRGVSLTDRGRQLLPYARRVVGLLDETATALREKPLSGPVRVGIPDEYVQSILPAALASFSQRHPETQVTARCDFSAPQLAALRADEIDLAVVYEGSSKDEADILAVDPTVWVTSISHAQHLRRPLPIAIYFSSDWCRDYALHSLEQIGMSYYTAFECDTSASMRSAVMNGISVAPLARSSIPAGCRELTVEDGFVMIDNARVVLHRNPAGTSPAIDAMAVTLRDAFCPLANREG